MLEKTITELYEIGSIKFGTFTLKNGSQSNYYVDLRKAISRPQLLAQMSDLMWRKVEGLQYESLCGVPYAALALCSGMSLRHNRPMIMVRKEAKEHGTKQMIEGVFNKGDRVLLVEDVITSGGSIATAAQTLISEGLVITDAVVFLEREPAGVERLKALGIRVHSVINVPKLFEILGQRAPIPTTASSKTTLTFSQRAELTQHPLAKELFCLMEKKQTNLAASADITDKKKLLAFIDAVGPSICVLKTHADIVEGFDSEFVTSMQALAKKHQFLIFEDRKFADIGNTVAMQYQGGHHKIASWANIINAHALPGPGLIQALHEVGKQHNAGLLLIPQLSSKGALTDDFYAQKTVRLAAEHAAFVVGFIAQKRLGDDPHFIYMTPGIHMATKGDQMGQQYTTPEEAIVHRGTDVIIVGRGLYEAEDPRETAEAYRAAGWKAYQTRLQQT